MAHGGTGSGDAPFTVPYYSSIGDIATPAADAAEMEFALIISHGAVPDPGGYYCAGMEAASSQNGSVGVIAPWYLDEYSRVPASDSQLQWNSSQAQPGGSGRGWRGGADCHPSGGRPGDVSSYRVLDIIVELLLQRSVFPKLRGVIMWGDSAGGQVLSRYALSTHLASSSLCQLRILSSNPSSFPYPSPLRHSYTFTEDTCELGELKEPDADVIAECPGYDSWLYGISGTVPPYVEAGLRQGGAERLPSVAVTYLQGAEDVCNEDGTCGTRNCTSGGLDRGCEAMLQGPMRLWRGVQYKGALDAHYGRSVHTLLEMEGVGHDAYQVVRSPDFIAAAFDGWDALSCPSPPRTGIPMGWLVAGGIIVVVLGVAEVWYLCFKGQRAQQGQNNEGAELGAGLT